MAYDERFGQRVRDVIDTDARVSERRMFGGIAFLFDGNMALAVSGIGGLMVRVEPAESTKLIEQPGVSRMVMRGREMKGWLLISEDQLTTKQKLRKWVEIATTYAMTLPPKQ